MRLHLPDGLLKRAVADLSDLTASQRSGEPYWADDEIDVLVVPMDPEPSEAEQEAIRRRLVSEDADDEARLYRLIDRAAAMTTPQEWIETELARYGETT